LGDDGRTAECRSEATSRESIVTAAGNRVQTGYTGGGAGDGVRVVCVEKGGMSQKICDNASESEARQEK
jgi:hypothetical protein